MFQKQFTLKCTKFFILTTILILFVGQSFGTETKQLSASEKLQLLKQQIKQASPSQTAKPKASPSTFTPEMPLREAIDILRNSTVPPLNIVVLWKDLDENADIQRDTPIGIDGVTGVTLRTHLELLLTSLSSGALADLGYEVDGGVIIIATKEALPNKYTTRVYDISDLVAPPSTGGMMGMGMGMMGMGMGGMGMMGMGMGGMGMGMGGMPFGNMMSYGLGGLMGGLSQYGNMGLLNTYGNQNTYNTQNTYGNPNILR